MLSVYHVLEHRLYLKNQQYPEEIVEHGIQKALEKGPIHTELREQVHVTSNQNNIIRFRFFGCLLLLLIIFFFLQYIFHTFATVQVKFNLFHKMENIVIPWIISSYKRIILF
jgi:hypothetical protein